MYDSLFTSNYMLNEQIANELFRVMPQEGVVVAIIDDQENCWPSDQDRFCEFFNSIQFDQVFARIADGDEPVIAESPNGTAITTQLTVGDINCGYLTVALENKTPEEVLVNMDIVELILNQVALIGFLINKNNQLHHEQLKLMSHVSRN